jgi:hypothetical protein
MYLSSQVVRGNGGDRGVYREGMGREWRGVDRGSSRERVGVEGGVEREGIGREKGGVERGGREGMDRGEGVGEISGNRR